MIAWACAELGLKLNSSSSVETSPITPGSSGLEKTGSANTGRLWKQRASMTAPCVNPSRSAWAEQFI
jgi:hypothetical protein